MILDGLFISVVGFSTVICFLLLLVLVMMGAGALVKKFSPVAEKGVAAGAVSEGSDAAEIAVAIAIAHRQRQKTVNRQ